MSELNKIVCQCDEVGVLKATVLIDGQVGGKITLGEIHKAKERLQTAPGARITDFGSARLPGPSTDYEVYATLGVYTMEWQHMDALILFQQEVRRLTGITCCIDCSSLSQPKPELSRMAAKRTKK